MQSPKARAFKDAAYGLLAGVGKAFASPVRLEILDLLAQGPRTVEAIAREIGRSVAVTSHHLQVLKRAHLVRGRARGVHVVYSLADRDVPPLLDALHRLAERQVAALARLRRDFFTARDGLEPVDRETLLARVRRGEVTLVDVRPEHEYAAGHLPGAISIPLGELESRLAALPRGRPVVAYCRGPYCALSADAARRLRALGYDARRTDASVATLRPPAAAAAP